MKYSMHKLLRWMRSIQTRKKRRLSRLTTLQVLDYSASYRHVVNGFITQHPTREAMSLAVGGNFDAFGVLMHQILVDAGLRDCDYLIDVGCGSGRLARALRVERYLGTDVVPELLEYARSTYSYPGWRFTLVDNLFIPERTGAADMVCFFSVFTHLLHEDTFRYLEEACRVLKGGGKIVFSFLEFRIGCSWEVFAAAVATRKRNEYREHTQFVSRDWIEACAAHLNLDVEALYDGDVPHIRVPRHIRLDDGREYQAGDLTSLGQSVCVLRKRA
jgi:SAM-dependent methyltransferase